MNTDMKKEIKVERFIDHTLLKADATRKDIEQLCREAVHYHFYAVCVNSSYVPICRNFLEGSSVKIATVVGFPLGASLTEAKVMEAQKAIEEGADEIDMVIHIGKLKDRDLSYVENDISCVKKAIGDNILKVIIETFLLTREEIIEVCNIILKTGADFVKTSTGFSNGGANLNDIILIKEVVGDKAGIKASGGIRRLDDAVHFLNAGATRIGTSNSVAMMKESDFF